MAVFIVLFLFFEPIRIFGTLLVFFWIVAIGMLPVVAVFKVMTGSHR